MGKSHDMWGKELLNDLTGSGKVQLPPVEPVKPPEVRAVALEMPKGLKCVHTEGHFLLLELKPCYLCRGNGKLNASYGPWSTGASGGATLVTNATATTGTSSGGRWTGLGYPPAGPSSSSTWSWLKHANATPDSDACHMCKGRGWVWEYRLTSSSLTDIIRSIEHYEREAEEREAVHEK